MDQLVGGNPISRKFPRCGWLAYSKPQKCWEAVHITPGRSLQNTMSTSDRNNKDSSARNGKATVVNCYSMRGILDMLHELAPRQIERSFGEVDLDRGASNLKRLGERDWS